MKNFSYFIVTLSLCMKLTMFCTDMLWQGRGSESGLSYK